MESMLGTIEVGKLPWMALVFAGTYWKTAVAAVWGLGFAYILVKRMKAWYKDDARDAAIGMKDEDQIFSNMKVIAKERRPARTKEILTKGLFWMPLMAFGAGKKVAKVVFYPVIASLDKSQTEGLEEGKKGVARKGGVNPLLNAARRSMEDAPAGILIEGENATKCMGCSILVGNLEEHSCRQPVVISDDRHRSSKKVVECSDCGQSVVVETPHKCDGRVGPDGNGMIHCKCGTSYKEDGDFDHVCPEETVGVEHPHCSDCDRQYDPTLEVHAATSCKGCGDVHCKRHDCGQRV
jgi:hypothetical protein